MQILMGRAGAGAAPACSMRAPFALGKTLIFQAVAAARGARKGCFHSSASSRPPMEMEEHTSELQSQSNLVCRLLLEKKKKLLPRGVQVICSTSVGVLDASYRGHWG